MATDLILRSLPPNFKPIVQNFNMHNMRKTITELYGMLKNFEVTMEANVAGDVLVQKGKGQKRKFKGKSKGKGKGKKLLAPKGKKLKDVTFYFCDKPGHYKRSCPAYLEDLRKKKGRETTTSGAAKE